MPKITEQVSDRDRGQPALGDLIIRLADQLHGELWALAPALYFQVSFETLMCTEAGGYCYQIKDGEKREGKPS